jgi:hypothetical protein
LLVLGKFDSSSSHFIEALPAALVEFSAILLYLESEIIQRANGVECIVEKSRAISTFQPDSKVVVL